MNSCYVIWPLMGLITFAGVHGHYASIYRARAATQKRTAALEKQETERLRDEAQAAALRVATLDTEVRMREVRARSHRDEMLRRAKLDAEARYNAAIERLAQVRREHASAHEEIGRAASELASREVALLALQRHHAHVTRLIAVAENNRTAMERLNDQLEPGTNR